MTFNTEHGHKQIIRQKWATPILKFLNKRLGHKLLYLGLPSPEAEDVLEWLDYLKKVIAFQCDDDRYPDAFKILFEKLQQLETEEKIENFEAYYGYIEKVVLQGFDDNENPQSFELDEVVTLYNLDFCNNITEPMKIIDNDGNLQKVYKFDAVRKLLSIQQSLPNTSKFVFFLTVHCSYVGQELNNYLDSSNNANNHAEYVKTIREQLKGRGTEINARIVRLFVIDTLSILFKSFGFVPKFLPTILYQGIKDTHLLTFTVVGARFQSAGVTPWLQQLSELIKQKFVTVDANQNLVCHSGLEMETDINTLDAVQIISSSSTFQKYWQNLNA
jgi:hypothetical protein